MIKIKKDKDIIPNAAGLWKNFKGTGVEYGDGLRKGWRNRRSDK